MRRCCEGEEAHNSLVVQARWLLSDRDGMSAHPHRRAYDRQHSSSGFGSPRGSRSRGDMRYASDNQERRATASYAWDYQRRHSARQHKAASARGPGDHFEHRARERSSSSAASGRSHESMFERFAERQRKREEATAARTGVASGVGVSGAASGSRRGGHDSVSAEEHAAQTASGLVRFLQVGFVFGFIVFVASLASRNTTGVSGTAPSSASTDSKRRRSAVTGA